MHKTAIIFSLFFFLLFFSIRCESDQKKVEKELARRRGENLSNKVQNDGGLYNERNAKLYLVTDDLVLPLNAENEKPGIGSEIKETIFLYDSFDKYVKANSDKFIKLYKKGAKDSLEILGANFGNEEIKPYYPFTVKREFGLSGWNNYFLILVYDVDKVKGLNIDNQPFEILWEDVEYLDFKKNEIKLKNGFIGRCKISDFNWIKNKEFVSKLAILTRKYVPYTEFGETIYKQDLEIKPFANLEIGEIDYICSGFESLRQLANSLGKTIQNDPDFPFLLRLK